MDWAVHSMRQLKDCEGFTMAGRLRVATTVSMFIKSLCKRYFSPTHAPTHAPTHKSDREGHFLNWKFSNSATTAAVSNNVSYCSHRLGTVALQNLNETRPREALIKEKFKNCPNPERRRSFWKTIQYLWLSKAKKIAIRSNYCEDSGPGSFRW